MAEKKNIYESIALVMDEIGAVGKDSKNPQQGYLYRGIDAVMNALQPALRKAKMFIVPEVIDHEREERTNKNGTTLIYSMVTVKYGFFAEDGSHVFAVVIGEGMDSGDKSYNKALSAAYKYACFQTFCIPTEEMLDSEKDDHEVEPKAKAEKKPAEKKPTGQTDERVTALLALAERAKVKEVDLLAVSGVNDLKSLSDVQYEGLVKKLNKTIESKGL